MSPDPKPPKRKKKTKRLSPAKMKLLNEEVLERDGHRCQNPNCESGWPLDVPHHVVYKSRLGKDEASNLITLCVRSHRAVHDGKFKIAGKHPSWTFTQI